MTPKKKIRQRKTFGLRLGQSNTEKTEKKKSKKSANLRFTDGPQEEGQTRGKKKKRPPP